MRQPDGSRASDYDYELATERIARYPTERRDESRLLVLAADGSRRHLRFRDVGELFRSGDLLVVNESRVLPARLLGRKPTGAPGEILLTRPLAGQGGCGKAEAVPGDPDGVAAAAGEARFWEALVRPGSKLKPGRRVVVSDELSVEILDSAPGGGRVVRLVTDLPTGEALERWGHMPLPPYIDREDEPLDRERYQTVYSRWAGSVAAPTAGLHFTPELLRELEAAGVRRASVVLHVGIGTFRPVEEEDPSEHEMHAELYAVPGATARAVTEARERGGRVWAVGTTVVRTLESAARGGGRTDGGGGDRGERGGARGRSGGDGRRSGELVAAASGSTDLFIRPPFEFRVVDGLITNFHLPRSTLLMLVAAFAGYGRVMEAYREAAARGYRFYSYGDAMAVEPVNRGVRDPLADPA